MKKGGREKRVFFDLNHPADFHFFKNLIRHLTHQGYSFRIVARNKECLHELLKHEGIPFVSRGAGSHSIIGKYLFAGYILMLLALHLIRFRPSLTISLSSPYLVTVSRILSIPTLTYDDTDDNPRLLPLIRRADYLFSPAYYPYQFHKNHFHIHTFKELAYLKPSYDRQKGDAVFFRLTRTDSVHHKSKTRIDLSEVYEEIKKISQDHITYLSSEENVSEDLSQSVLKPDRVEIHRELNKCSVFWGNSATMAAESAVLGIPAVFVGTEKFSYLKEIEENGLLFAYSPDDLRSSFIKVEELVMRDQTENKSEKSRIELFGGKINITGLLSWFIGNLPESARILSSDPEYQFRFRL